MPTARKPRSLGDGPADVIHAWDERALMAAILAGRGSILFSPAEFPTRRSVKWVRRAMRWRDIHVVCPSAVMYRRFASGGVPCERFHLIRPGLDCSRIRPGRDRTLRNALGFGEDDYVLLAPGDSTRAAAHREAVWSASILHVLDGRYRILLWGPGRETPSLRRLAAKLRQPNLLVVAEQKLGRRLELDELLPAADLVLATPRTPVQVLPIAACMAAGLPILATASGAIEELLKDGHNAVLVPRRSPRLVAQRVLELREDPALLQSIAQTARSDACELFSHARFVAQYRALYQQLASRAGGKKRSM